MFGYNKETFLPRSVENKIDNQNIEKISFIKNNIYKLVLGILQNLKNINSIALSMNTSQPQPPQMPLAQSQPQQPQVPLAQPQHKKSLIENHFLDGHNMSMYDSYMLISPVTNKPVVNTNKPVVNTNKPVVNTNEPVVNNKPDINKVINENRNYIKSIISSLDENIYNMHQNIFDLDEKNNITQLEINTYHLEMLIYAQFLFKKLEKNIMNPVFFDTLLDDAISKINTNT
jgi:hypothetical protein